MKKKEIVARLVPKLIEKKQSRKLGIYEGKMSVKFDKDFKMTEEDFIDL